MHSLFWRFVLIVIRGGQVINQIGMPAAYFHLVEAVDRFETLFEHEIVSEQAHEYGEFAGIKWSKF